MAKTISKKTIKQMQFLGYEGDNPTVDEAVRWLREKKGMHVMPIPHRVGKWCVASVDITRGHVDDENLFSFSDGKLHGSHDAAALYALSFVVDGYYRAMKEYLKHGADKEFFEKARQDAIKMGLAK